MTRDQEMEFLRTLHKLSVDSEQIRLVEVDALNACALAAIIARNIVDNQIIAELAIGATTEIPA
jgi:hypothetical protein